MQERNLPLVKESVPVVKGSALAGKDSAPAVEYVSDSAVEEFALAIRTKFETNDFLPDEVLVNIFLDKYPMYSCKVKRTENKGGCSCC